MGIYDTMAAAGGAMTGNGGSFAQKQQLKANPIMRARPAMGAPMGAKPAPSYGQPLGRPNPMTGARPGMQTPNMGMAGPRRPPVASPIGGSYGQPTAQQLPAGIPNIPNLRGPGDVHDMGPNNIGRPDVMARPNLYGSAPEMQAGLGPSNAVDIMQQQMPQQPVVMDENGLEPRRGPR
jgi:hypothetical protein